MVSTGQASGLRRRTLGASSLLPLLAVTLTLLSHPPPSLAQGQAQSMSFMASLQGSTILQNLGLVSKPSATIAPQRIPVPRATAKAKVKVVRPVQKQGVRPVAPAKTLAKAKAAPVKAPIIQLPQARPMAFFDAKALAAFKALQKGDIRPLMLLAPYGSAIGRGFGGVNGVRTSGGFGAKNAPPPPSREVVAQTLKLEYHGGRLLSGPKPLVIHPIWYGKWVKKDQDVIRDFILSFTPPGLNLRDVSKIPAGSVARWWAVPGMYQDKRKYNVSRTVLLGKERTFARNVYGNNLTESTIRKLIRRSLVTQGGDLPAENNHVYVVLNGPEVFQTPSFCRSMCAFHDYLPARATAPKGGKGKRLAYAWIGNPSKRCPEYCGFPYTKPPYIPAEYATVLKPANGNILTDGMVGLLAHELAEIATDPFISGWFAGSPLAPNEVADMCIGTYGMGAFPSNPGDVRKTPAGLAYNVDGIKGRKFLVPWIWDNPVAACAQTP